MTVAAIVLRSAEQELLEQFKTRGARSRETAMTPSALAIVDDRTFRRLRDRGVIREGAPGTFYVDEATAVTRRRTTRRLLTVVLILATSVAIVLLARMR